MWNHGGGGAEAGLQIPGCPTRPCARSCGPPLAGGRAMPVAGARAEEGGGGGEGAAGPARLCGYLQKLSGKGPLRGYRSRWFVFDARRCHLYYFKSPQDALPLGRLDIADACFCYPGADEAAEPGAELPAHFQVHSAGAVAVLKVGRPPRPASVPGPTTHALRLRA